MYAVIESGGKQHRVTVGSLLKVEKLDAEEGSTLMLDRVLMCNDGKQPEVGRPYLENAKVTAEVLAHGRHRKVRVVRFRRRKNELTQSGHRQWFTQLRIIAIGDHAQAGGAGPAGAKAAKPAKDEAARTKAVKAEAAKPEAVKAEETAKPEAAKPEAAKPEAVQPSDTAKKPATKAKTTKAAAPEKAEAAAPSKSTPAKTKGGADDPTQPPPD